MKLNCLFLALLPLFAFSVNAENFNNPVHWQDFADLDVIRVGDTYYYSGSNMHYSPGAPILRSYDLVNWEIIGHSVPTLDFGSSAYNLVGGSKYVKGIFASTLQYRKSTNTYYWIGCIEYSRTYIYTASSITGPWNQRAMLNTCYYDCGLLIDDDDKMYVAYGNTNINVAQLSSDGLSQVKTQQVFTGSFTIEGSRFYKRNGAYYILVTRPANEEHVLKSTNGPFGPYTMKPLVQSVRSPLSGSGYPHQGGLVNTPTGDWYYMAFIDAYPGGRIPVLAPVTWSSDGWPSVTLVNGGWGSSYAYPATKKLQKSPTYTDTFTSLGPQWEWNHNPDNSKWSINNGLVLQTVTVTGDLYAARNTITHRILGPTSYGTVQLDISKMFDGDRAGLALLRDSSAYIGIKKEGSTNYLVMVNSLTMDSNWKTTNTGVEVSRTAITGSQIWLRMSANIAPSSDHAVQFYYSTDGSKFTSFGSKFTMITAWQFFMGYRFAIFNHATKSLGGSITVRAFTVSTDGSSPVISTTSSPIVSPSPSPIRTTTTTAKTTTTTATSPAVSPIDTSDCAAQYAQCGGSTYTGTVCCKSPYTCQFKNSWYSQCL
ncbi:hypothetical protein HK098_000073 [Nowakowskiella sp. JEL0407]|nr:hypothetical protein HK098_000073 [Nowakowskiella sp. JEL0407]